MLITGDFTVENMAGRIENVIDLTHGVGNKNGLAGSIIIEFHGTS